MTIVEDLSVYTLVTNGTSLHYIYFECEKEILSHVSTRDSTSVGGYAAALRKIVFCLVSGIYPVKRRLGS